MGMTGMPVLADTSSMAAKFSGWPWHGDASVDNGQWQQLVATAQVVRHHADDFFVYLVFVEVYERRLMP